MNNVKSKKTVRTDVVFVTFSDEVARRVIEEVTRRYNVTKCIRSQVVRELYYISVEGEAKDIDEYLKRSEIIWYKKDYVEFK